MTRQKRNHSASVLVIGGGISGCTVAGKLARAGIGVHLVERNDVLGGRALDMGCKATDTCMRCNVCVADETLRTVARTPGIDIHLSTQLTALNGNGSDDSYEAILEYRPDSGGRKTAQQAVTVDAVVLATGHEPYHPVENPAYGYDRVANVITGMEAERQLATQGTITRPSDGQPPQRVAFVQCVGSRTEEVYRRPEDTNYCSGVCCAYALRIARRMKHDASDRDVTVFYMDIQHFGKDFNTFYAECRKQFRFVRSRPYEILPGADGSVRVKYTPDVADSKSVCEELFDLVVLSIGIRPPLGGEALAEMLGVALDEHGFYGLKGASPLPDLLRPGFYVVGTSESPKDMAGCMAQAEAASAVILGDLKRG